MRWPMRYATLLLLFASPAFAAPPLIDIPPEVRPAGDYVLHMPKTDATSVTYVGLSGVDAFPSGLLKDPRMFALQTRGLQPGRYRFAAVAAKDGEQARTDFVVLVGDAPTPPGPGPDPMPPAPVAPLRVIFVYETAKPLTPQHQQVVFGEVVRQYLDARSLGWRRYDKDVVGANEPDVEVKALWTAAKGKVAATPCVVIGSAQRFDVVPMPADETAAVALFQKYGGKK